MTLIREEVRIAAPALAVWEAVHVSSAEAARWSGEQVRVVHLDGVPGPGTRVRYDIALPGGFSASLILEHTVWSPPRRCAGIFVGGPLTGTWSYVYREARGATLMIYEMDYELGGLMRFAGGMFRGQYAAGVRDGMGRLKAYLESGRAERP